MRGRGQGEPIRGQYTGHILNQSETRILLTDQSQVGFNPGDHHFLENILIQLREIDGKEAITIVFYAGPEQ